MQIDCLKSLSAFETYLIFKCIGCPVDQQSKTVIKNGDFARVSILLYVCERFLENFETSSLTQRHQC